MSKFNSRAIAATVLADLVSGSGSLTSHLKKHKELTDFSLLQETCYGCCRWFILLEHLLTQLLSKPLKNKDNDLKCLLIVGLYQLRELAIAEYAVINETVAAVNQLGKPWAKPLVNAVLRNYLRKKDEIEASLNQAEASIRYSHPAWFIAEIAKQWPPYNEQILSNNNLRPPMTLRVNQSKIARDDFLVLLADSGISAATGDLAGSAIYLEKPLPVESIPGFNQGLVSIQDEASQLVPGLLQLEPGIRVLDACAAPGGKTCHLLESECLLTDCIALDVAPKRLAKISENLKRLDLTATLVCGDATRTDQWWDGDGFDRILLDAPCSATGVLRRHPDIKLLRRAADISSLVARQKTLIESLWQCLKPGGLMLYTSCSILHQENQDLIGSFLESTDSAKYEGVAADWGVECRNGRQLLPGAINGPDGFFFSLLRKI